MMIVPGTWVRTPSQRRSIVCGCVCDRGSRGWPPTAWCRSVMKPVKSMLFSDLEQVLPTHFG